MNKHAYLIIAHNEFYILEKLLKLLDNDKHDIYLHIDKKVKNFDFDKFRNMVTKSKVYFTDRLDVRWGDYSQIKCELLLLKEATKNKYSYYHLLSGVDMPLKRSDDIYSVFEENKGCEFIGYLDTDCDERAKYYHFFVRGMKSNIWCAKLHFRLVRLQKKLKIDRLRGKNIQLKKGANWFSITDDCARYVLENEKFIRKNFRFSYCCDEVFLHTLIYNSKFKDNLYVEGNDEHANVFRYVDWTRGQPYTFLEEDFLELIDSNMCFARKFSTSTKEKKNIVDKIYRYLGGNDD